MNNVYILLELARADKTGVVYEKLMVASKPFYLFITANRGLGIELRESFLTMTQTVRVNWLEPGATTTQVVWRNYKGHLHRKDGYAILSETVFSECPFRRRPGNGQAGVRFRAASYAYAKLHGKLLIEEDFFGSRRLVRVTMFKRGMEQGIRNFLDRAAKKKRTKE